MCLDKISFVFQSIGLFLGIACMDIRKAMTIATVFIMAFMLLGKDFIHVIHFLARRDECPESYCLTPGVGISVRVHKNLTLPITHKLLLLELSYFTCVFLVTRPFHGYQNF